MVIDGVVLAKYATGAVTAWGMIKGSIEGHKMYAAWQQAKGRESKRQQDIDVHIVECEEDRHGTGGLHDRVSKLEGRINHIK